MGFVLYWLYASNDLKSLPHSASESFRVASNMLWYAQKYSLTISPPYSPAACRLRFLDRYPL